MSDLVKSKERVKRYGEVFTPKHIVKEMSDLVEPDISDPFKKVLEPACGDGNFLVEILNNVKNEYEFLMALGNIYGVELLADNREKALLRMFEIIAKDKRFSVFLQRNLINVINILHSNILQGNFLKDDLVIIDWEFEPVFYEKIDGGMRPILTKKHHQPLKK